MPDPVHENLRLDRQLCFALYAATHALTRAYRGPLGEVGLTYPQYLVMLVLWEADGLPLGAIARALSLDAATLTPLVKRIEQAGLVSRQRSASDERIVEVRLTGAGRRLQSDVARIQQRVACQTGLAPAEFEDLRRTLHQLVDTMSEATRAESRV
jgi:DNA-binding MarR family transcriptional regulator